MYFKVNPLPALCHSRGFGSKEFSVHMNETRDTDKGNKKYGHASPLTACMELAQKTELCRHT